MLPDAPLRPPWEGGGGTGGDGIELPMGLGDCLMNGMVVGEEEGRNLFRVVKVEVVLKL